MKRLMSSAIAALLLGATSSAFAYDGFATGNVNLRAGPDLDYPVVTTIPAGEELSIQGCTDGWEWCDVVYGDDRGWVAGNYIQYEYNDQPVLLSSYGGAIGVPIVSFVIGDYWGHYYRSRPFWGERDRWYSRPYIRRAPPPAFRGDVHDWGHDHYHGGYDHGHGYSGHGPEYHGGSHGAAEFHGSEHGGSHGEAEFHGSEHGGSHGGQEYHGVAHGSAPEYHGGSHGAAENHAVSHVDHGSQPVVHGGQQPQGYNGGGSNHDSYHGPAGHNTSAPQVHAVQQQQHAAPQQHSESHSSGEKGSSHDHDKDHGH